MQKFIIILSFIFCTTLSFAQTQSFVADSMANLYSKQLPAASNPNSYKSIISARIQTGLHKRIDTLRYNYVYLEETYHPSDSTRSATEYYFNVIPEGIYRNNFDDKTILPDLVFIDGKQIDQRYAYYSSAISGVVFEGKYEYYYTLDTILLRCKGLLPVQEITYDPTPKLTGFANINAKQDNDSAFIKKSAAEKKHLDWLKSTYQIVTLIDKTKGKTIVSVQTPAKNPAIHAYSIIFQYRQW